MNLAKTPESLHVMHMNNASASASKIASVGSGM